MSANSEQPPCLNCERTSKALEAATRMNGTYAERIKHLEVALAEWEKERLFLQSEIARLRKNVEPPTVADDPYLIG